MLALSSRRGRRRGFHAWLPIAAVAVSSTVALGQDAKPHDHTQMHAVPSTSAAADHAMHDHGTMAKQATKPRKPPKKKRQPVKPHHATHGSAVPVHADHGSMQGNVAGHGEHMVGFLGPYGMTREGSGTSWVPDATPHEGLYQQFADWGVMTHGALNLIYDRQPGPRGASQTFVSGMLMTMAQRQLGDSTFGVRAMMSPEPFMGARGYPLLLANGETADGRQHLVDRQHPHDLFMELATTYSVNTSATSSVFVYAGLPGEPALGPPAFMHRTSGMDNPEAPISHHWLDSTHITFGVVTAVAVVSNWKFEASAFRGREPDQYRYDIERPALDSFAGRVSWNPTREWSLQVSYGRLTSPEQLAPAMNENRLTASAIYTTPFGDGHLWSTTLAWGRKMLSPGDTLDAYLLESAAILKNNVTLFMRAERVAENELTHDIPGLDGRVFTVNKVSVGGVYDFMRTERVKFGIGGLVSRYVMPDDLKAEYGRDLTGYMVFGRLKLL